VLELIEGGALIHSVNLVEVMTKVQQAGGDIEDVRALSLNVVTDLPVETAERCASLHKVTRAQGLSLGDCICLGVAALMGGRLSRETLPGRSSGNATGSRYRSCVLPSLAEADTACPPGLVLLHLLAPPQAPGPSKNGRWKPRELGEMLKKTLCRGGDAAVQ
jgi:hypothetical protein